MDTINDVLNEVYKVYNQTASAPDYSSDDWAVYVSYANRSLAKWENKPEVDWKELVVQGYSLTLVNGQVTLPANFKEPLSYLTIGTNRYHYVIPERYEEYVLQNNGNYYYTITGVKGAKTLVTQPNAGNVTGLIDYKKYANTYSTGQETAELEMKNPDFLFHDVMAQIYTMDENILQAQVEFQIADAQLNEMAVNNEKNPYNNESVINDDDFIGFGSGTIQSQNNF